MMNDRIPGLTRVVDIMLKRKKPIHKMTLAEIASAFDAIGEEPLCVPRISVHPVLEPEEPPISEPVDDFGVGVPQSTLAMKLVLPGVQKLKKEKTVPRYTPTVRKEIERRSKEKIEKDESD